MTISQLTVYRCKTDKDEISKVFNRWRHDQLSLNEDDGILILRECLDKDLYAVSEQGLSIWLGDGDNKKLLLLTDTLILPYAEVRQHSVKGINRMLQLIGTRKGSRLVSVTLTPAELSNMRWIREAWGFKIWVSPTIPNANQYILDCIYRVNEHIPVLDEYCQLGWTKDYQCNHIYITGSEIIGMDDTSQIYSSESLKELSISCSDISEKKAYMYVFDVVLQIAPRNITYTAFSFMLLSLTSSAFHDEVYKADFLYYLYGASGSRKTSLSKVFFNLYERYWDAVPINFTATQPAMELMMVKMRDTVVLIDDIAPSINAAERNSTEKKLESIVRAYGDSTGRQKMGLDNKAVNMKPNGLAAITAEDNIFKNPSSMARCFITHIEKDDVNLELLTDVQNNRGYYPTAITYYIADIAKHFTSYTESLKSEFLESKRHFTVEHVDVHGRLLNTAAWLDAAFSMYIQYGERRGFLRHEDAEVSLDHNKTLLHQWIKTQSLLVKNNNEVDMYIQALTQLVASNMIRIPEIKVVGRQNKVVGKQDGVKIVGYRDFDKLYLFHDVAYGEIRNFYARQGLDFSFSQSSLFDQLQKRGILKPDNNKDGTKTVRIKVNGQRVSVIRLNLDAFRWWGEELPS